MKKIIYAAMALTMVSLFGIGGTEIQGKSIEINEDTFPDDDFQMYVSYAFDTNRDGKLSDSERNAVKEIRIGRSSEYQLELEYNSATSVKGIEYFPNLEKLDCSENIIEKLDVSKLKNLKELRCAKNDIGKLNLKSNLKLTYLDCEKNKLKKLDVSKNKNLLLLYCGENKLKDIDLSKNKKLKFLAIDENRLTKLNLQKQKNLQELYCEGTNLKELNLKYNKKITTLDCRNNKIEKLDLAHLSKLDYLHCSNNKLRKLDLRNNKLIRRLYCKNNNLVSGNLHVSFTQLEDCEYKNQKRTIKVKRIGKYYYVPIKNLNRTNVVTNLSAGKITDKGIRLKGKKIPKKITYQYNMFTDGDKETKVTIIVKK
ncbi:MAG: hypothetical protein J5988_04150 [Eubacterium sp.]|nr:hypothetical protein [Eubacterium sp.]